MIDVFPRRSSVFGQPPNQGRSWKWAGLCLCLTLLSAAPGQTEAARLLILPSQGQPVYQQLVAALTAALSDSDGSWRVLPPDTSLAPESVGDGDLLIALGTLATRRALALPEPPPILSVFIPRRTFERLVRESPRAAGQLARGRLGALYLEQPFSRQLDLAALIAPRARTLGTLLGPASLEEQTLIEAAGEARRLQLLAATLREDDNPIERLAPVVDHSDVFLAVPDKAVFNRSTARWILLMTLRQRIPLIAYSKRYVEAGAVAAVYSTTDTVGREAALQANQWLIEGVLPAPGYPRLFEVSTNAATARMLRLDLPDPRTLEEALRSLAAP